MTPGKIFEQEFKASVPSDIFYYRFRDGTANFSGQKNENVRFQKPNICDCLLVSSKNCFFLELKSIAGASISLNNFRGNQIKELSKANRFDFIIAGFIVNFRKYNHTYFIDIEKFNEYVNTASAKSIPISFFESNCLVLPTIKVRVRHKYLLKSLLEGDTNKSLFKSE